MKANKNNDLHAAITSSLRGTAVEAVNDISKDTANVEAVAEPIVTAINKKIASPQGGKYNRATFLVDPLIVAKMKTVASIEQRTYKATVERALLSFLHTWQITHPFIDLDAIKLQKRGEE